MQTNPQKVIGYWRYKNLKKIKIKIKIIKKYLIILFKLKNFLNFKQKYVKNNNKNRSKYSFLNFKIKYEWNDNNVRIEYPKIIKSK